MEKFLEILMSEKPSELIKQNEEYMFSVVPGFEICKGFDQMNPWHIYDVYEHILHVIDGVPAEIHLRLAALFHDLGKPSCFWLDDKGVGHFFGHWVVSQEMFMNWIMDKDIACDVDLVSALIYYHDISVQKMSEEEIDTMVKQIPDISMLYALKRSDLFAYAPSTHSLINDYEKQENFLVKKYKR